MDQPVHILGKRRAEQHFPLRCGMWKGERVGVERVTVDQVGGRAVEIVTRDGMTKGCEMHTQLMRASRNGTCLDQCMSVLRLQDRIYGARGIRVRCVGWTHLSHNDAFFGPVQTGVDHTVTERHFTVQHGKIGF